MYFRLPPDFGGRPPLPAPLATPLDKGPNFQNFPKIVRGNWNLRFPYVKI